MKRAVTNIVALVGLVLPSVGLAQELPYSSGQPWVSNRTIGEGAGIRSGNLEWHPGVSGEFGYDSNFYQRSTAEPSLGDPVPALRLRVSPQLSVRTLERRLELADDEAATPPPPVAFDVRANLAYNELISLDSTFGDEISNLRNLEGALNGTLQILPKRKWSGGLRGGYNYTFEPSNQGGFVGAFNRHTVNVGGNLLWMPGGGAFEWNLVDYGTRFTLFDQASVGIYNNGNHRFSTKGRWRFFPKTALLFDGGLGLIDYDSPLLNSGENLQGRVGVSGLLTTHLGLLLMGGWGSSFFHNDNGLVRNYDDFLAKVEAKWYLNAGTRLHEGSADVGVSSLALGYDRSLDQSYLSDFLQRDRIYGNFGYFFGGRVVTSFDLGFSFVNYPDFLFDGTTQAGFEETRLDMTGFVEYRIIDSLGVNATINYDQAFSQLLTGSTFSDDLSFSRVRAFLGVRWFL